MKQPDNLQPILCDARMSARLCSVGLSLWYCLDSEGRTPQCTKLHSRKLWVYEELQAWSKLHCPSRDSEVWQSFLKGGEI